MTAVELFDVSSIKSPITSLCPGAAALGGVRRTSGTRSFDGRWDRSGTGAAGVAGSGWPNPGGNIDSGPRCAIAGHSATALAATSSAAGKLFRQRIFGNRFFNPRWCLCGIDKGQGDQRRDDDGNDQQQTKSERAGHCIHSKANLGTRSLPDTTRLCIAPPS